MDPVAPRFEGFHPLTARSFSERGVVILALAVAVGTWWAQPVSLAVVGVALVIGGLARRAWIVGIGLVLLAGALAANAVVGATPMVSQSVHQVVTLRTDPVTEPGGVRVVARIETGDDIELHAQGPSAVILTSRLAGERVALDGVVEPRPDDAVWLKWRHVVGRVPAAAVTFVDSGSVIARAANGFRHILTAGAASLPIDERALYTGFVFGDDRAESPEVADDFLASGLSHLLAVSGENVAFVLVAVGPLVRRLGPRSRFLLAAAVLVFFALATRLEPSVLRATAMALIACFATVAGREISVLRSLALAVTALLLIDPFLVHLAGFQLSVMASLGIVTLARPFARHLVGPGWLRDLLGVTLAAQVGVAPVLVVVFGSLPVVTVIANVLAVPAAGPVMVWGLTAGLVAGLVGGSVAGLLQMPTHALLWWVKTVARIAARASFGELRTVHVVLLLLLLGAVVAAHLRFSVQVARSVLVMGWAFGLVIVAISIVVHPTPAKVVQLGPGSTLYQGERGEAVLVIDGRVRLGPLLRGLRSHGVRQIDVIVARSAGRPLGAALPVLVDRFGPRLVLQPAEPGLDRGLGFESPAAGAIYAVGALSVRVTTADGPLGIVVEREEVDTIDLGRGVSPRTAGGVGSPRGPP